MSACESCYCPETCIWLRRCIFDDPGEDEIRKGGEDDVNYRGDQGESSTTTRSAKELPQPLSVLERPPWQEVGWVCRFTKSGRCAALTAEACRMPHCGRL